MKRILTLTVIAAILTGCVREAAIPLGNDLMEISVSTSAVYRRAGAQEFAINKAAQAALDAGYDKFIVVQDNAWNEKSIGGASYGSISGNTMAISGQQGSFVESTRSPEVKMIIRMFHDGEKGSEKAVDARSVLKQKKDNN